MNDPIVDAEAISDTQEIAVRDAPPVLTVTAPVQPADLVARLDTIRTAMNDAMVESIDYGRIPGTNKPALLKPGAEKLSVLFQLDVQIVVEETYGPGDHLRANARATVWHAPTGSRLGHGEGLCSTRERKYAYRKQERSCPFCQVRAIIKGKDEFGGGWVCFKKKDGCGKKFHDGDPLIEEQEVGEIENPDLPELWNTVIKMAEKRARVDAILAVTGASALFTQDEDQAARTPFGGLPYGPTADEKQVTQARKAMGFILGLEPTDVRVHDVLKLVHADAKGYLPVVAVRALGHLGAKAKEVQKGTETVSEAA